MPTLTVLFVDQVESTALLFQRGERAVAPERDALFRILRAAVASHGGEVIDHTGDGVMAFFRGAREALDAATAMQAGAARLDGVRLRIGINSGEPPVDGDGRYFGMPLVVAARLCAKAAPDEVLASTVVKLLTGEEALVDPTVLDLKGIEGPVEAYRYDWRTKTTDAPLLLPVTADLPLAGRDADLDTLQHAWRAACEGQHGAVFVSGEPGSGKSRLVAELLRSRPDATAVIGRCDESAGESFQPFAEALRSYVQRFGTDMLGSSPDELARLVPELPRSDRPLASDPEVERQALFAAVRSWLAEAAAARPTVLVIDDLHWAADSTVKLLVDVLRAQPSGLLVVTTFRDVDASLAPLGRHLADLLRLPGTREIRLEGLDVDAVRALASGAGVEIDAEELRQRTGGNALFVTEMLRTPEDKSVPKTIARLLSQRIALLPAETSKVLTVGALAGLSFAPALVEEALAGDLDSANVIDDLEAAESLGLLQETHDGECRFTHALIRDALLEQVGRARSGQLHGAIAAAAERLDMSPAVIAHHLLSTQDRRRFDDMTSWSIRAAHESFASAAFEEVVAVLERALSVAGADGRPRALLLCELGMIKRRLRAHDQARPLLIEAAELAERFGDAETLAAGGLGLSGSYQGGDVDAAAAAPFLAVAERRLDAGDSPLRARVLAALAVVAPEETTDARQLISEAEAMAARLGDRATSGYVSQAAWTTMLRDVPAGIDDVIRYAPVMRERCAASGVPEVVMTAPVLGIHECALQGDLAGLARVGEESEALGTRYQLKGAVANGKLARAALALVEGKPDEAEALWADGFALAGQDNFTRSMATSQLVWLRRHQGRLGELEAMLLPGAVPRSGNRVQDTTIDAHVAMALAELGRADAEEAVLDVVDRLSVARGGWTAMFVAAIAATVAGSTNAAQGLIPVLEPWSGRYAYLINAVWFGPADGLLGDLLRLVGRADEALALYDRALAQIGTRDAITWTAQIHHGRASALHALGRTAEAADVAGLAAQQAARAGLAARWTRA